MDILRQVFPKNTDYERVLCHILHGILKDGSKISCDNFIEKSFASYITADVPLYSLRSDTNYFSMMGQDHIRLSFFRSFVEMMRRSNPNFGKAIIEDVEDVQAALEDPDVSEMTLNAALPTTSEIQVDKPMTINGAGNTVTKSEPGKVFTMTKDSTIEDIVIENTADNAEWNSSYGVQFYTGEHTVKDSTFTGGNAGIIANSATVNLEGTIDVSGNTFGGIEVCRSQADARLL